MLSITKFIYPKYLARNVHEAFVPAWKTAKVENFRFHDLRHTFVTLLVHAGVDLYIVQGLGTMEILVHGDAGMPITVWRASGQAWKLSIVWLAQI